jgi:NAD-dependent dihydropyrimidine dehydrogenase PreA subunit
MKVDQEKCIGCGICIPYCPANAISIVDKVAVIDQEKCFECGNCIRNRVVKCPTKAFYEPKENVEGIRSFRRFFSDPATTHKSTGIPGRGTEEVKTNDVTGRVCRGEIGIAIELGRPYVGTTGKDIEKVCTTLTKYGVVFEENNPLIVLMSNADTGEIKEEFINEVYISAIVEFGVSIEKAKEILEVIKELSNEIDTVFSLDLISCFNDDMTVPVLQILEGLDIKPRMNAKINLGMGRPYVITRNKDVKEEI